MIPYGKSFDQFGDDGLAKPGTVIVIGERRLLIGDINELGGVCDDCMHYDLGYRGLVIIDAYEPPK